ncbi:MAG: hypothetical protein Q9159_002929 [Coniocarpon cinnabarinum]
MGSSLLSKLILFGAALNGAAAQSPSQTSTAAGTSTTFRPLFSPPASDDYSENVLPTVNNPQAVDAQDVCPGYTVTNVQQQQYGVTAQLNLAGPACSAYGNDVDMLDLTVQRQSGDRLNIEIKPSYVGDNNVSWFETPSFIHKPGLDADAAQTVPMLDLDFVWGNDPSFWFSVVRKSNNETLFTTQGSKIVFEDQFVELKSPLPQDYNLYGLAETIRPFRLSNNFTKTMWAADVGDVIDANIYGSHPIYYDTRYYDAASGAYVPWNETSLDTSYTSLTHGLYYRNAHGHEILMQEDGVTWRTIGGNIDLYFYAGPTVENVAQSYQQSAIGLPVMQQYFTFGYHQCRWGYSNWSVLSDVVDSFEQFQIPLENIWTDIDYMKLFRDFTTDPNTFPQDEGRQFLDGLHASGRHYIPIVDSAIYRPNPVNETDAYGTYNRGHDAEAFILQEAGGDEYVGTVWPGYTVFPDWYSEGTQGWWTNEMVTFHNNNLSFDGIWIDMSEVSSFCIGSCGSNNLTMNPAPGGIPTSGPTDYPEGFNVTNSTDAVSASSVASAAAATSSSSSSQTMSYFTPPTPTPGTRNVNFPPYTLNNYPGDLRVHAMDPNGTHHNGVLDYDVHNLFGHQILNATYIALQKVFPGKRPFIIGRSTFAGSGSVAGHWGGDNYSLWAYMVFSISQALSFSLSGIPMFGVDTCGFNGNTDEELCARWMQLSAFFPFYRNHNTFLALSQEPYQWAAVADATKTAMDVRFALLPYMYTLFQQAHMTGSTVMRALQWEYPNDPSLANADHQFMLGSSVLVTPVLEQGASTVNGVFPGNNAGGDERWYDWYNQTEIVNSAAKSGRNVTIDAPLGHIPVYTRGGSVLPLQPRSGVLTTAAARQNPWSVLVSLNSTEGASGSLYLDDGESLMPNATKNVDMQVCNGVLTATVSGNYQESNPLANVTVLGLDKAPGQVMLNGAPVSNANFDQNAKSLSLTGLDESTSQGAWSASWTLSWA